MRTHLPENLRAPLAAAAITTTIVGALAVSLVELQLHDRQAITDGAAIPGKDYITPQQEIRYLQRTANEIGQLTIAAARHPRNHPEVRGPFVGEYDLSVINSFRSHPEGTQAHPQVEVTVINLI
jgi:hypothetical protein